MKLAVAKASSQAEWLFTSTAAYRPSSSLRKPSFPIENLRFVIKFGPFCSVQRGSIDLAGGSAARQIAKATTVPAIHTTKTRKGALSSSLRVLTLALSRGETPPRRRTRVSYFPAGVAAPDGKRGDPAMYPPFSEGSPRQLPIGSSLFPVGLGPRIACCVAKLRRRSRGRTLPPAPFYSSVI